MHVVYSPQFVKDFERLEYGVQKVALQKEKTFRENPFDGRLKTHKLSGRFEGYWSFRIDYDCRVIFRFQNENTVKFVAIGGHSIYR